jgi:hypothetical protein
MNIFAKELVAALGAHGKEVSSLFSLKVTDRYGVERRLLPSKVTRLKRSLSEDLTATLNPDELDALQEWAELTAGEVARLRAALRCGAYVPFPETDAHLDPPARALPCTGGSLDVAGPAGLYAAAPGPHAGRRPPASLATSPADRKIHSRTGPTRVCDTSPATPDPGFPAKTLRALARASQRQALGSREAPPAASSRAASPPVWQSCPGSMRRTSASCR